ncbi:MAG TPA: DUF3048 domain-containing protein [Candidatus Saccharimonadales bacterium]|nr:DUF3048 domain-containing protein [Candidatus Saccharimonadales bacterium]
MKDIQIDGDRFETSTPDPANKKPKPDSSSEGRFGRFKNWLKTHHTRIILGLGVFVVAPVAVWAYLESTKPVEQVSQDVHVKKAVKPQTEASPLTGVQVDPALAARPITAAVIENHTDARPQSGLSEAGVVYEALAEGGITRFEAFYLENRPKELGPIRSVRTYFVDWALEFNAPLAHAGGNADALDIIGPLGMKDMNEFVNGGYFYRSKDRFAPHNLYTSSDQLDSLEARLGYNKPSSFKASPRKKDTKSAQPAHPDININYSYNGYQVEYKYNADCNCYDRFLAGAPHIDRNTGKQIQVKNVVVQYMPTSYGTTRIGEQTVIMGTPGSGKAIVFTDGGAVEGTWSKAAHGERTKLLDAAGKDIPLNAGNTWYSIVPTDKTVSY